MQKSSHGILRSSTLQCTHNNSSATFKYHVNRHLNAPAHTQLLSQGHCRREMVVKKYSLKKTKKVYKEHFLYDGVWKFPHSQPFAQCGEEPHCYLLFLHMHSLLYIIFLNRPSFILFHSSYLIFFALSHSALILILLFP